MSLGLSRLWFASLFAATFVVGASLQAQPAEQEKAPAFVPMSDVKNANNLRCVVKKDTDRDFKITIRGTIGEGGVPLVVKGSDGATVLSTTLPAGKQEAFEVKVPKDGKAGEYVIFILTRDGKESLAGPLTDLPKEVYVMGYWIQNGTSRFFTRSRGTTPEAIEITPHKSPGSLETKDGKVLAQTDKGETMKASIGPDGAWISTPARYVDAASPVTLAGSPEAWFAPSETILAIRP